MSASTPAAAISSPSMRPRVAAPAVRRRAAVGQQRLVAELVRVDDLVGRAHRVDEPHRQLGRGAAAVAQHRHQRHDAGAAADQQHRLLAAPDEVGGERPTHLDLVASRPARRGSRSRPRPPRAGRSSARSHPRRAATRRSSRSAGPGSRRERSGARRSAGRAGAASTSAAAAGRTCTRGVSCLISATSAICHWPGARWLTGVSRPNSALPSRGRRGCGSRWPPRSPARRGP